MQSAQSRAHYIKTKISLSSVSEPHPCVPQTLQLSFFLRFTSPQPQELEFWLGASDWPGPSSACLSGTRPAPTGTMLCWFCSCWIAQCLRSMAAEPEVGSSIPLCGSSTEALLDDP